MTHREHMSKEEARAFAERIAKLEAERDQALTRLEAAEEELHAARAELQEAGAGNGAYVPGSPHHVALWDAINLVVEASGGSSSRLSIARETAVVEVEIALRKLLAWRAEPAPQGCAMRVVQLFHVKDGDRPLYVVARDWNEALETWRTVIKSESDDCGTDELQPWGIDHVCRPNELVLSGRWFESSRALHFCLRGD